MLSRALEQERMFALAQPDMNHPEHYPCEVCGLGLIRACVENADGTSNLILQGVSRIRIENYTSIKPYFIGRPIEIIDDEDCDTVANEALALKILEQVNHIQRTTDSLPEELRTFLSEIKDFHMLVDIVAGSFVREPERKQELLETANLHERLHILALTLNDLK